MLDAAKPNPKRRFRKRWLLLSIPLIVLLNLAVQWQRGRIYINPWPPITFLPLDDESHYARSGESDSFSFGHREYRLDTISGFATDGYQTIISRCGRLYCRALLAQDDLMGPLETNMRTGKTGYFKSEDGAVVISSVSLTMLHPSLRLPAQFKSAGTSAAYNDIVFFEGPHPPLVVRGATLPGEQRRTISEIVQAACEYQSIRQCPKVGPSATETAPPR